MSPYTLLGICGHQSWRSFKWIVQSSPIGQRVWSARCATWISHTKYWTRTPKQEIAAVICESDLHCKRDQRHGKRCCAEQVERRHGGGYLSCVSQGEVRSTYIRHDWYYPVGHHTHCTSCCWANSFSHISIRYVTLFFLTDTFVWCHYCDFEVWDP